MRYRVQRLIKRGGMAEVYEGLSLTDGGNAPKVALKILHHDQSPEDLVAFADEARLVALLDHPNVVSVLDYGTIDGRPFQALELVEGLDLKELQELGEDRSLPLPAEAALFIVVQVARALDYAHQAVDEHGRSLGIVHRDVTPHNVLVSWTGHVKLADFGIARATGRGAVTEPGVIKGKLSFMAPEYLGGGAVTPLADVFGLGCVLHYTLTGSSPFASEDARYQAALGAPPTLENALPDDIYRLVEWACHPAPAKRCPSAFEFASAAERALVRRAGSADTAVLVRWLDSVHARPNPTPAGRLIQMFELEPSGMDPDVMLKRFSSVRSPPPRSAPTPAKESSPLQSALRKLPTSVREVQLPVADPALPTVDDNTARGGLDAMQTEIEGPPVPSIEALTAEPSPVPATESVPVQSALERYTIIEEIRTEGMGRLVRAHPRAAGRPPIVVLKLWSAQTSQDPLFASLLTREAMHRRLTPDRHLPAVTDLGVDGGQLFVEMEPNNGRTVLEVLDRAGRPFDPENVAALGAGIVHGLAAARAVRRALGSDFERIPCLISLEHVLVTFDGRVLVRDATPSFAAEQIVSTPQAQTTDDVASAHERRALISTFQALLPASGPSRAQTLRRRIAAALQGSGDVALAPVFAALVEDPKRRLEALMTQLFASEITPMDGRPQASLPAALEPTHIELEDDAGDGTTTGFPARSPLFASPPPLFVDTAEGGQGLPKPTRYIVEQRPEPAGSSSHAIRWIVAAVAAIGIGALIVAALTASAPAVSP